MVVPESSAADFRPSAVIAAGGRFARSSGGERTTAALALDFAVFLDDQAQALAEHVGQTEIPLLGERLKASALLV